MSRNGHRFDPNLLCESIADATKGIRFASLFKGGTEGHICVRRSPEQLFPQQVPKNVQRRIYDLSKIA
jgi:hypothetical protein